MFKRWQQKWNVTPKQFWIIFIAFGFTGITTAYLTKQIAVITGLNENTWWVWKLLLRVLMLLFGYQVLLLFFGALFGQWQFFWSYEKKLLQKLRLMKRDKSIGTKEGGQSPGDFENTIANLKKTSIAIFASGAGSNAEKIIQQFNKHAHIQVGLIVCNKPGAGVLEIASSNGIPVLLIEKEKFFRGNAYVDELREQGITFIVLAGFLWKIPQQLIDTYRSCIINIHPALLPGYGGKGMYGSKVHEAVIAAGDKESGITIHYVDEHYDNGDVIFQAKCEVDQNDTPDSLAKKIHALEHKHFPEIIEQLLLKACKK